MNTPNVQRYWRQNADGTFTDNFGVTVAFLPSSQPVPVPVPVPAPQSDTQVPVYDPLALNKLE